MGRTLKQVKCGETVTVQKLQGEGPVKRRIMDMGITKGVALHVRKVAPLGITKGASVYVRKVAPLGDPVEVTVRGYELSLRKGDADMILVESLVCSDSWRAMGAECDLRTRSLQNG